MKARNVIIITALAILVAGCGGNNAITGSVTEEEPGKLDSFAQCISDAGATMYGAYWCPHCQRQKEMFGNSFSEVNYVECSLPNRQGQTQACKMANIQSYPTWEFADGNRRGGVLQLETLSQITGCELPE